MCLCVCVCVCVRVCMCVCVWLAPFVFSSKIITFFHSLTIFLLLCFLLSLISLSLSLSSLSLLSLLSVCVSVLYFFKDFFIPSHSNSFQGKKKTSNKGKTSSSVFCRTVSYRRSKRWWPRGRRRPAIKVVIFFSPLLTNKQWQYSSPYQLFGVKRDEMVWIVTEYQRFWAGKLFV